MRRRYIGPPLSPSDLCREDVGLMLALKAGISGKRGDEFRAALARYQAQVARVNERWTHAQIATVTSNPRRLATDYAATYQHINQSGADRMNVWAARLPEREDF